MVRFLLNTVLSGPESYQDWNVERCGQRLYTGQDISSSSQPPLRPARSARDFQVVSVAWCERHAKRSALSFRYQSAIEVMHSIDPQCGTVCRLLCATAVPHWTHSGGGWKLIFSDSDKQHRAPFCRFCQDLLAGVTVNLADVARFLCSKQRRVCSVGDRLKRFVWYCVVKSRQVQYYWSVDVLTKLLARGRRRDDWRVVMD